MASVPIAISGVGKWRDSFDGARTYLSGRVARLRELELELSKKERTLRQLAGGGSFQWTAPIVVGVCAMAKKATCKPMREILARLPQNEFEIKIFEERVILEDPIECWPICDCLIAFYSTGFPQSKVEAYVKLRKPKLINDLEAQRLLWDRRNVYKLCTQNDIPVPNHIVVNRDTEIQDEMVEGDDFVEVNGKRICKPFVEKPVDADCHEVFIYYPKTSGGGRKELFRKTEDRSSEFYPDRNSVRRDGSYIYEEFLTTEGTDVKVYAVTMDYAHAEARKSPVMDGRVMRDENNVEIRYPVILSNFEKDLARKVVKGFQQNVCGFDLLRSNGRSYVCDVNGWSFVKRSTRYHKDSALMLARLMRQLMGRLPPFPMTESESESEEEEAEVDDDNDGALVSPVPLPRRMGGGGYSATSSQGVQKKRHEELRAVIAVIRHGDRTPKQKLKIIVTDPRFLSLFAKFGKKEKTKKSAVSDSSGPNPSNDIQVPPIPSSPVAPPSCETPELKLKTAKELGEILRITNEILFENSNQRAVSPGTDGGGMEIEEDPAQSELMSQIEALTQVRAVLEMHGTFKGINRKVQLRCTQLSHATREPIEAQLILKWGGVLTPPGRERAELMGRSFRERMYPGIDGLIRLHSTYRHDLKIYASDEGRVQVTAAAFAKGLLDLDGHLTPILESLVKKGPEVNVLLHDASLASANIAEAKQKLKTLLSAPKEERSIKDLPISVQRALSRLDPDGPIAKMGELHQEIIALAAQLKYHLRYGGKHMNVGKTRGSVSATAFRGLRARSASVAENSVFVDATPNSPFTFKQQSNLAPTPPPPLSNGSSFQATGGGGGIDGMTSTSLSSVAPKVADEGGSAAASLGDGGHIDLDSNSEKVDRGDGAVTVRDLFHLACARWEKLQADFFRKDVFDISKVPDIFDCAKYDITHNPEMLQLHPRHLLRVYELSQHLADMVVPQEYGEAPADKFEVGIKTCSTLLGKIRDDLRLAAEEGAIDKTLDSATDDSRSIGDMTNLGDEGGGFVESAGYRLDRKLAKSMGIKNANRHVRTRLYFTSESHLHAVMNVLRYAHVANPSLPKPQETALRRLSEAEEMSYLCHIVLRLYEVTEPNGSKHHSLRIYVSDGISVKVIEEPLPASSPAITSMTSNVGDYGSPSTNIKVIVGSQPDKPIEPIKPAIAAVADLHSTGFGFSSFHQNIPLSPGPNSSSTVSGRPSKTIGGHHIKMLPPANPMIPLWLHLPLHEGIKLIDPNLLELVLGPGSRGNGTESLPAGSPAPPASSKMIKSYPMQRFDSNMHGLLRPAWKPDPDDDDD